MAWICIPLKQPFLSYVSSDRDSKHFCTFTYEDALNHITFKEARKLFCVHFVSYLIDLQQINIFFYISCTKNCKVCKIVVLLHSFNKSENLWQITLCANSNVRSQSSGI